MARSPRDQRPATPQTVYAELVKLARYTDSLQREMARLAGRIQAFDDETPPVGRPWIDKVPIDLAVHVQIDRAPETPAGAMLVLRQIAKQIIALERDSRKIAARMDEIADSTMLRDDIRPYLDRRRF